MNAIRCDTGYKTGVNGDDIIRCTLHTFFGVDLMRLTKHSDYSLRVLMYLALKPDQIHTILHLSEKFSVSRNHLMKVVNKLSSLGYVDAIRGRDGGIRLARQSTAIRIGDVVEDMEQTLDVVDCNADGGCVLLPGCKLKHALREATRAFVRCLNEYTLADLIANDKQLLKLVG
jgi:Rrf2 family nitric oxide-sensitive transcriptional repressor